MKLFKNIVTTIALCAISSMSPMQPTTETNTSTQNTQLQRPLPARPSTPTPTAPLTTRLSAHSRRSNLNPPQRALPTIPSQTLIEPTTTSSSTQSRPSTTYPPHRTVPTIPSPQELMESTTASSSTQPKYPTTYPQESMESTTASSSTQDTQFNTYLPQRTAPTRPSMQGPTNTTPRSKLYTKVLEAITTRMRPQTILVNNTFTDQFINFVKGQNLSDEETAAILEAVAKIYMKPTGNKEKDEQILLSLKNSIKPISYSQIIQQQEPQLPRPTNEKRPIIHSNQTKGPAKNISTQKRFTTNNLIMLLDPEQTEALNGNARLVVQDALVGLYEQAAPIIMSSNILEIITTLRYTIGDHNLQKLQNSNNNQAYLSIQQHENPYHLTLLKLIDFNNFVCYFHISENLVLIIPQQYITTNIEEPYKLNFQEQAKNCGFNTAALIATDNLSADNILAQLKIQQTSVHTDTFINNLTSFFIPQKKPGGLKKPEESTETAGELTKDIPWNIYIGGHGGAFYQSIGSIREQLKINKQNLGFYKEALQNNKKYHDAQNNITHAQANIKKYEKILQGKSDWPDSQLLIGQGNIAGMTLDDFSSLMKFFNQSLYVYFVHYTSCFDGGYKQAFVNEILSSLNVDFIVSTQGLDERQSQGIISNLQFDSQSRHASLSKKPFSSFFTVLKLFIDKPEEFVKVKKYKKEPFSYVLSAIVPNMNPQNQPFIRFPGVGIFGALSLGKNTINITKALVKAHEIENTPINLSNTDINIVTIIPSQINIALNFGKNTQCAIVSPTPATIKPAHEAIHIFKRIHFEGTLQSLIFNFISFNAKLHPQTFIIKQLTGTTLNNTIHNLIIHIKNIPGQIMRAHIEIAFEVNNTIYQCETVINNFEDPYLANIIYALGFIPTTDTQSLSNKFLTPQEVAKLTAPITLATITEFFNTKIDTQEPSLKDTDVTKELTEFVKQIPKTQKLRTEK